ncbi:hypothetical protein ACJJTC_012662 [Scirpophaga incertulas]
MIGSIEVTQAWIIEAAMITPRGRHGLCERTPSFHSFGNCPVRRQASNSSRTLSPRCMSKRLSTPAGTPSGPGAVLLPLSRAAASSNSSTPTEGGGGSADASPPQSGRTPGGESTRANDYRRRVTDALYNATFACNQ